jgi:hypothetical protein
MTSSQPEGSAVPGAAAADAEQQLRQEIDQTRQQLGDTVEALAGKADVKARAQAWKAGLASQVKSQTTRTRAAAAERAGSVRGQLADTTPRDRRQATAAAIVTLVAGYLMTRIWRKR